jgi:hypothetical protein
VIDLPGSAHLPLEPGDGAGGGAIRRFEVQYRLVDLDPGDSFVPAGLVSCLFDLSFSGGGNAFLQRAILSRSENRPGSAWVPAVSPDLSGPQTGLFAPPNESRGLHRPFYRSSPEIPVFPNNDAPENGVFAPGPGGPNQAIHNIYADVISAGPVDGFLPQTWFGIYTFEFVAGESLGTPVTLTAAVQTASTGNNYAFWNANRPEVPVTSSNSTDGIATIAIPSPGTACIFLLGICNRPRRRTHPHA